MDRRRSHSRRARAGKQSADSPSCRLLRIIKSLPAPFIFQNCIEGSLPLNVLLVSLPMQAACQAAKGGEVQRFQQNMAVKFRQNPQNMGRKIQHPRNLGEKNGKWSSDFRTPFPKNRTCLVQLVFLQLAVKHGLGQAQQLHGLHTAAAALGQGLPENLPFLPLEPFLQRERGGAVPSRWMCSA